MTLFKLATTNRRKLWEYFSTADVPNQSQDPVEDQTEEEGHHIQGRKIDQRSQQSNSCNLLGIVVFFATKIKASSKISVSNKNGKISPQCMGQYNNGGGIPISQSAQPKQAYQKLSSSHGEREASRVQSTRLDSATTAHQAKSSVAGRLSQKYYNRKTREMTGPHLQPLNCRFKNQSEKLTRDGANSKFCLKSCLNIAEKLELRKQIQQHTRTVL